MQIKKTTAILLAVLAAAFYAVNVPFSKLLLNQIGPTFLASLLYFGAGIGIGILYLSNPKKHAGEKKLTRKDLPYTIGMILLDIAAPILLMLGLESATSANASLLGNFEIVATSLIALFLFREKISRRLWIAIALITLSSGILSFEDMSSLHFSGGSLLVLAAAACWGLENNCTRNISDKSTFEIVFLKASSPDWVPAQFCASANRSRNPVQSPPHSAGLCGIRAEHLLLRPCRMHWRRQNQRLLCRCALYRNGALLHHLAGCAECAVLPGAGSHARRLCAGRAGHPAAEHTHPHTTHSPYPRRRDTYSHDHPQSRPCTRRK
ncbi:MAG: DMT family transporter [Ruminococcus sp.]